MRRHQPHKLTPGGEDADASLRCLPLTEHRQTTNAIRAYSVARGCTDVQHKCYPQSMTLAPESSGTAAGRGRLIGRRIVVVGAGTRPSPDPEVTVGNGRAIAVLCAREGASVA